MERRAALIAADRMADVATVGNGAVAAARRVFVLLLLLLFWLLLFLLLLLRDITKSRGSLFFRCGCCRFGHLYGCTSTDI